jgi:hypothetical protein
MELHRHDATALFTPRRVSTTAASADIPEHWRRRASASDMLLVAGVNLIGFND